MNWQHALQILNHAVYYHGGNPFVKGLMPDFTEALLIVQQTITQQQTEIQRRTENNGASSERIAKAETVPTDENTNR